MTQPPPLPRDWGGPADLVKLLQATSVRPQMSLTEAAAAQFRLVDAMQSVMGSDAALTEDYGQARSLGTLDFGAGGRPFATARVEETLSAYFGVADAVLVAGAGTGAIRAMINAALGPAQAMVLHSAPVYKTVDPVARHMGLRLMPADFNDPRSLTAGLHAGAPAALYLQHVPQQLGDWWDPVQVISLARERAPGIQILADDNYAVMRVPRLSVQLGADASAFSMFKLLSPANIGCVLGSKPLADRIRRDLSSAGCQVQGPDAMQALRSLVYVPVALALQDQVVTEAAARINALIAEGRLDIVAGAVAAQPAIRSVVLVFSQPVAEEFLASAWRHGSPGRSVGEEAATEVLPLFTYLTGTFLRGSPGLQRWCVRVNPMRGGPDAVLRVLQAAAEDPDFRRAAAQAGASAG
jgi:cystathionine beta-lyase/cystathionine gamma-synthase